MRRFSSPNEVLDSLTRSDDRSIPFASSAEGIQNLCSQNGIGQHSPDFIEDCYRRTKNTVRIPTTNLLVNSPTNCECNSSLEFRRIFQAVDVVAEDVFL